MVDECKTDRDCVSGLPGVSGPTGAPVSTGTTYN